MILAAALARLPPPADDWEGRHTLGPRPRGTPSLSDLAQDDAALARLVGIKQAQAKGGDAKLGCAYLIGDLGWELGSLLSGLWLSGWRVSAADPAAVALSTRAVAWEEADESGVAMVFDLPLDPGGLVGEGMQPDDLARAMTALLSPLIAALTRLTGLGATAQWRLVGDGLAAALVHRGKALGCLDAALDLGRSILSERPSKLRSRQTEFIEIRLPHRPDVSDWFRLRGGCCRYYTAAGESGEYCATCVLRDRDDQIARLADWLDESRAPPQADLDRG